MKGKHKGKHHSPDTEFKKGQRVSPTTEFQKGHIPTHGFEKGLTPHNKGIPMSIEMKEHHRHLKELPVPYDLRDCTLSSRKAAAHYGVCKQTILRWRNEINRRQSQGITI